MFFQTSFSTTYWKKASFRVLLDKTSRLFMLLVFLFSIFGGAPIQVQAQTGSVILEGDVSSGTAAANSSSVSVANHTTGTGSNRLMLVGVSWNCGSASTSPSVSSITFSGSTVATFDPTPIVTAQAGTACRYAAIYGLPNPPIGETGTVTVSFNGSVSNGIVAGVANFADVDLADPFDDTSNAGATSGTAPSADLTGLDGDELAFDTLFIGGSGTIQDPTVGAGQTKRWSAYNSNTRGAGSTEQATTDTVTMSWTITSTYWAVAAVAINPAPAGPTQNLSMAVSPSGGGTTEPSEGNHTYPQNEVVNLTATPNVGYVFDSWTGDADCTDGSVTMDVDKACAANFTAQDYDLMIVVDGNGSTDPVAGVHSYGAGTVVDITATPDPGNEFDHWDGACTGTDACQVTMDGNKSVTAYFVEGPPIYQDGEISTITADGVDTLSFSHTIGTGTNQLLLVGISINNYSTEPSIDSVSFNYDSTVETLTLAGEVDYEGRHVAIYGLSGLPYGQAGMVEVNFSEAVGYGIVAGAANFAGVDQAIPWGTFASATGQSATQSVDVTGLAGDELVFDTVFMGAATIPTMTVGADQTELWNLSGNRAGGVASTEQAAGESVTMSWSTGSTSVYWAIGAVPINPAEAGPLPSFAASFPEGTVQGYDWPLGVNVSITIDDPDNGEGVDYTDTQTVVVADWDPSMTVVNFPLDGFALEPGQFINMTDGITLKEHTVTDVTITDVNLDTETATGMAAPGTDVWVLYCNMSDCPEDQNVTTDGSGNWSVTFTDIQAGDSILAHQFDDDSDHTAYEWRVPFPTFSARFPAGVVHGYEWPEGELVTISIDDPTNGVGEDYTTSETVGIADWDPNMTFVEFTLDGFVLEPGHIITMTHGTTVKVHTVTNVTIIAVDIDAETVEGTADPGTDVTVDLCNDSGCEFQDVIADGATGDWSVTFADIVAGDNISAMQHDEDGDHTAYEWRVLKPYIEGSTNSNWVHARDWPDGTELTLEVDDPSDGTGDVDYTVAATMGPAPWNPGDPNDIVADFDMDGFDLQPDHILHITDGLSPATEVTYALTDLAVTEIDVATDIISGVATLSDAVQVCANVADNCVFRTSTPSGGIWDVDYGGEVDLVGGINGWAAQYDIDGNVTWFDWRVPNPNFEARPLDNLVEGFEWPLGAAVTLEVNGTPYNSPQTVSGAPWNPDETYVSFDLNGLHDLVPGDLVTLTDGVTLKEHSVTGLTVVDVDDVLNMISGTTDSTLNVDVWEHNDYENSHVTVTPESGDWTADLNPFDLDAGHMGAAAQYDGDGDGTWIEWWVPYTLTINIDGLGSGSVELDPEGGSYRPGTEVTLTAIPESGSAFTGWSGDLGGGDNPTSINMDGNKVVVANFELVDKTNLYVDVSGSDSNPGTEAAPFATIQKAVDELDPGGTVHVGVGTYIENVVITKSLTLMGSGVDTIIQPAVSNPNPCTSSSMCGGAASNVLLVQADDVIIHDLTVDGDNPALTGLDVGGANVDARNGIIKNTDATYNNLEVYNVTVKNIYLRGIYSTNGSFNFHGNTVTNVQGDSNSIAMFAWGGPGVMEANTVSYANDGVSANHSNGIQFLNNVVTHSLSGVHTDNSGDSGGVADLIQGNSVDCTDTPGAYGVWVFVPYIAPTVNNNTVTNCDVGLSAWGQGAAVTTQFTNNTVIGNLAAESVGAYITTDLISWGYRDVSVNFSGNEITGFETGVFLAADEQSWNPEPYEAKTINATFHLNQISGNTAGADKDSSGTYLADFENNWWGDATGPQSPVWNGGGDTVSAGFDYSPWCTNAACTEFAEEGYTLTIVSEHGTVTKTPDQVTYQLNDMVSLEVTPVAGWNFTDWSGDISGTDNPITVTITGDMNVTANFSPAAVTHSISLVPGWNLVSFNLQPVSTDIEDVLSSVDGNYNLVYAWDASGAHAGSGNWMKYDPAAPAYSNSLSSLDETMGFWIYMEVADILDVMGYQPTTTEITLTDDVGGWNLVAYPSTFNGDLPEVMSDQGVGSDFSLIYAYHANDTGDPWKLFDLAAPEFANDLSELAPGWGYWVRVSADNTWSVEYAAP